MRFFVSAIAAVTTNLSPPLSLQQRNVQLKEVQEKINKIMSALVTNPYGFIHHQSTLRSPDGKLNSENRALIQSFVLIKEILEPVDLSKPMRANSMEITCSDCKNQFSIANRDVKVMLHSQESSSVDGRTSQVFCAQCKKMITLPNSSLSEKQINQ